MTCPICEGKTKIVDSRRDVDSVRRRRECRRCFYRFTTIELEEDLRKKKEGKR